ncbi:ParB/RepB/Spo0J family partition protein [Streptomyces cinnamoneus]|uniref:ParB/RepB/Spo0J family partition protein n=1 Tax=Streptomyces cinnamoneus TaxID=53446 RepID=UPI000CEDCA1C|nr:ParB N-terminal domain-containing protein [Streptomyces cinnamoneus]PPT15988.1 streptomycin biosynthesis protein [Streptomyces cinnamoneus]
MTVTEPEHQLTALLPLDALLTADSPRTAGEDPQHVRSLARLDVPLPPIVVHRATMRVVDGMHRLRAARLRGDERIAVRFFEGTAEDAFVYAVRANNQHGTPLTQADRSAAAERIIRSHPQWSDRLIASAVGLAASTVASLRRRAAGRVGQVTARTGRDGRVRPLNAAEGRRRACALIAARPQASLREIADVAGIAVGTARDVRMRLRKGQDPVPKKLRDDEMRQRAATQPAPVPAPADRPEGVPPAGTPSTEPPLPKLRKDPSLRFSESGRTLLQLLSVHAMGGERWRRLLESVPAHRRTTVAQAARHCAESWLRFAIELERRSV